MYVYIYTDICAFPTILSLLLQVWSGNFAGRWTHTNRHSSHETLHPDAAGRKGLVPAWWAGHHCVQQRCHVGTELEAASVTVIQHRTPLSTWNPADFPRFQPVSCQAKRCRSRPHLWWCGERICMLCGLWCLQPDGHHALWAHWILGYNATRVKNDLWNGQLSRNQWNSDQERVCPNIVDLHAAYSTWQT